MSHTQGVFTISHHVHNDASHRRAVCATRTVELGNSPYVDLMLAGDLHIGEPHQDPHYMTFIRDWVNAKPDRYLLLDGDVFNAAIVGGKSDVYGETMTMNEAMSTATEWLRSVGSRLIINVCGNHDERIIRSVGIDPLQHASCEAGVVYDGLQSFTTIHVGQMGGYSKSVHRPVCYDIYCTHGVGGGRSVGAKANNLMRLREIVVADLYVMGHQHDTLIKPASIYEWNRRKDRIIEREQLCIVTPGGLMRGGYAVSKAYAPTSNDIPVVRLSGTDKRMTPRLLRVE